jgi:hypothetical protein
VSINLHQLLLNIELDASLLDSRLYLLLEYSIFIGVMRRCIVRFASLLFQLLGQ